MKKKIIITIALIIVIIVIAILHHHKQLAVLTQKKNSPILVHTQKPISTSLPESVTTTGSLIADKSTVITPRASGYIRAILFHEGETVKKGQVLFQLDAKTQQDALIAAKAADSLSQLQFKRDQIFLKKGFVTQDTFYAAKVAMKQNQAALETAETNLSDRTITAPFDGTLGSLTVSLGDYVNPGNTLTTLIDNKHLRVEYALPVKDVDKLQLNQAVIITDTTGKNKMAATVSYISPQVDATTQMISVHARVNNTLQLFKPGEYVTLSQNLGVQKNTLQVPEQSVLASINGYHVFVVKHHQAIKTPVKIGNRMQGNVVIISGIKSSDAVIVAGQNEVKNGADVKLQ